MLLTKSKSIIVLFAAVVLEMEFVPESDLRQTAQYLRSIGIAATSIDESKETITITPKSYNQTMKALVRVIPTLPDIYKLIWRAGDSKAILFENWPLDLNPRRVDEIYIDPPNCARFFL